VKYVVHYNLRIKPPASHVNISNVRIDVYEHDANWAHTVHVIQQGLVGCMRIEAGHGCTPWQADQSYTHAALQPLRG